MDKKKVLIIKTGYSEILEGGSNSRKVSLGDILRITPLLHLYKEDTVTWVTDNEAFPLLEENPFIHKLLPYDFTTALQLESEEFDKVINLEKIPGICALSDKIRARRSRYGFTFNSQTGNVEAYDRAYEVLAVSSDQKAKRENKRTSQELLFEMVGAKWNEEEYILGYKPTTKEIYDVALNTQVGQKWPSKSWHVENWNKLEKMLTEQGLKVTRQDKQNTQIFKNLYLYMDWINSSKIIVTNDSLGLHLGIAMKKYILGLFGSTPSSEVYFYKRGEAILPVTNCEYFPCFERKCVMEKNCIDSIEPKIILDKIKNYKK